MSTDRTAVLAAVSKEGVARQYLSPELRADREVVLAAVTNYGKALRYASYELRDDREVVLADQTGYALWHASTALRGDREVVLTAVRRGGSLAVWCSSVELSIGPLLQSWTALSRFERNWRRCREAYKGRTALWFWMEEPAKRVHKEAPPLEMGW